MRAFARRLEEAGHSVRYLCLDDPANQHNFEDNINHIIKKEKIARFEYLLPDEYRLDQQLNDLASRLPVASAVYDTEHFLTTRSDLKQHFKGKKRFLMESFYRQMRKQYNVLMDGKKPVGGKWNFDQSNRNRYDGAVPIPAPKVFKNDVTDIAALITAAGIKTMGEIKPKAFIWPINRKQALQILNEFLDKRLPHFGTYQDAMTTESWSLFHARISFALNTKMLGPMEVIEASLRRASGNKKPSVGIEQLEGFIRQILGWREYAWHLLGPHAGI